MIRASALLAALFAAGCTPQPQAPGEGVAPNAAACQKTGQQCRLGKGGALGVCFARPEGGGYSCTPQH